MKVKQVFIGLIIALLCGEAVAGDFLAGVFYTTGIPSPEKEITLTTNPIVHLEGLGIPTGSGFVFETATNNAFRFDTDVGITGVEVVVVYHDSDAPTIFIYDWSCSPESPCADGSTGPSYQWNRPIADMECFLKEINHEGEVFTVVLPYQNTTRMVKRRGGPSMWQNEVRFFNSCRGKKGAWQMAYSHVIDPAAAIGVVDNAMWGPFIETFLPFPVPVSINIPAVGFFGSRLIVDGKKYPLDPSISRYQEPIPGSNLETVLLDPNKTFVVRSPLL